MTRSIKLQERPPNTSNDVLLQFVTRLAYTPPPPQIRIRKRSLGSSQGPARLWLQAPSLKTLCFRGLGQVCRHATRGAETADPFRFTFLSYSRGFGVLHNWYSSQTIHEISVLHECAAHSGREHALIRTPYCNEQFQEKLGTSSETVTSCCHLQTRTCHSHTSHATLAGLRELQRQTCV